MKIMRHMKVTLTVKVKAFNLNIRQANILAEDILRFIEDHFQEVYDSEIVEVEDLDIEENIL